MIEPDAVHEDGRLVGDCLTGEASAFGAIHARYFPRLVRLARRLGMDGSAEDVAQETLIRALLNLRRFDPTRPLWPWLQAICRNLAATENARHRRQKLVEQVPDQVDPGEDLRWVEARILLLRSLTALTRAQRAAIATHYLAAWDRADAATALGLTGPAFRQLLFRARARLREELTKLGETALAGTAVAGRSFRRAAASVHARLHRTRASLLPPEMGFQLVSASMALLLVPPSLPERERAPVPRDRAVGQAAAATLRTVSASRSVRAGTAQPSQARPSADQTERPREWKDEPKRIYDYVTGADRKDHRPEETFIVSAAFSPAFPSDRTVYAAGMTNCRALQVCPILLFRSIDAGRTWQRLEAQGFHGMSLLLPPAFGRGDDRIFAMGDRGLQVSEDGGRSFVEAAPGASAVVGTAAMSPGFSGSDPTILIGGPTLSRYRDDLGRIEVVASAANPHALIPVYAPDYLSSGETYFGASRARPGGGNSHQALVTCTGELTCNEVMMGGELPTARPSPDIARTGLLYVSTPFSLHASLDRGQTLFPLSVPWQEKGTLRELAVTDEGWLLAAVAAMPEGPEGLFVSEDGGASWWESPSDLFADGATGVWESHGTAIAARAKGGVACSTDGGHTWARRCH